MDVMSQTDSYGVMRIRNSTGAPWSEIGQTEIVADSANPEFAKSFPIEYFFEQKQYVQVEIRDADNSDGTKFELVGFAEFQLGKLIGSKDKQVVIDLVDMKRIGTARGKVVVRAEKMSSEMKMISFSMQGIGLTNFGMFSSITPLISIYKPLVDEQTYQAMITGEIQPNQIPQNKWVKIYESEKGNGANSNFRVVNLTSSKLYGSSKSSFLRFELYNWKSDGNHKFKGFFFASAAQFSQAFERDLMSPSHSKSAGKLRIQNYKEDKYFTFTDYIYAGLNMNLYVCIDFTGSNGSYSDPNGLHYRSPDKMNQYQQSIISVVDILQHYDNDKMIQTFGFGGILRFKGLNTGTVSHFFPCSGDPCFSVGFGAAGVLELYNTAIQNVDLSGPTYFSPLLKGVIEMVHQGMKQNPTTYNILLIMTDGTIHDDDETIYQLVKASQLPLSVIIIGVGNDDFSDMHVLDGDGKRLHMKGETAVRDIVQFVQFNHFNTQELLAQSVLRELPDQVTQYYRYKGRAPKDLVMPY